jgi:hypothetical protein
MSTLSITCSGSNPPSLATASRPVDGVRWDKVDDAKAKLARGEYDDPSVIDAAVDQLLQRMR